MLLTGILYCMYLSYVWRKIYFNYSGKYAPIDASDAGGMNLLDLNTMDWSQKCLDVSLRILHQSITLHILKFRMLIVIICYKIVYNRHAVRI